VRKKQQCLLTILLTALLAFSSPVSADIYGYRDKEGVMHLTNIPSGPRYRVIVREERVLFHPSTDASRYDALISESARKHGVDDALVKAVIRAESNFDSRATSRKGAKGLMQLMPQTAQGLQVKDCFRPEENIDGGVRYLRYLLSLYDGSLPLALAAYNAGEKAVARYQGIPPYPETQTYIERVMRYCDQYRPRPTTAANPAGANLRSSQAPGVPNEFESNH